MGGPVPPIRRGTCAIRASGPTAGAVLASMKVSTVARCDLCRDRGPVWYQFKDELREAIP